MSGTAPPSSALGDQAQWKCHSATCGLGAQLTRHRARVAGSYIDQSCKSIPASRMAYDRAQAERLWDVSMKLVGLPPDFSVLA